MGHKSIFLLAAVIIFFATSIPSSAFQNDKVAHFAISSISGIAVESYLHWYKPNVGGTGRVLLGTLGGSVPGLMDEMFDQTRKGNHFSGGDMAADVAGAFVGSVISNLVNNRIQINIDYNKQKTVVSFGMPF